jgi:hypothetical protein
MAIKCDLEIDEAAFKAVDVELSRLEANARGPAINRALRAIGNGIGNRTRAILPKAGYLRHTRPSGMPYKDKGELKPLGETPTTKIVEYAGGMIKVAVIGYAWPAGAHGHLVEQGHDLVKGGSKKKGGRVVAHVAPAEYMVRVVVETREQQSADLINAVRKLLKVR